MSIKVVEGQVEFWKELSAMWKVGDNSMTVQMFRDYLKYVSSQQTIAPDVLPRFLTNAPSIVESTTGKIVDSIS